MDNTMNRLLNGLFPQARAEVLRCLFADPSREIFLRELTRQSGLAIRTIQVEVEKLAKLGLLVSRKDGNRVYWRANSESPVFSELRSLALKTIGFPEQLRAALAPIKAIECAFVFGSFAAGTETGKSDVDLMVMGAVGLRVLAPVLRPVAEALSREINPHSMTVAEFGTKLAAGDAFAANVLAGPKIFVKGSAHELERMDQERMAARTSDDARAGRRLVRHR